MRENKKIKSLKKQKNINNLLGLGALFILTALLIRVGIISVYHNRKERSNQEQTIFVDPQQVFKPTEKIFFVLDLGQNPKLSSSKNPTIIENIYAQEESAQEKASTIKSSYQGGDLTITTKLINSTTKKNADIPMQIEKQSETKYQISGEYNKQQFVPGKYELQVEVSKNEEKLSFSQDFNWGVLAVNTDKSVYTPGEIATIALAVLDEKGDMVCNAKILLEITNPSGQKTILGTETGEIVVNKNCSKKEFIEEPDFETIYQIGGTGNYQMRVTALTENGSYTINDNFEVRDYVPFSITRKTATRIYPPAQYPVNITIVANEDFSGKISEIIPEYFEIISNHSGFILRASAEEIEAKNKERQHNEEVETKIKLANKTEITTYANTASLKKNAGFQTLTWNVDLKKGDEYYIQYVYDAPDISPEFYLLGPLSLSQNNQEVFKETRQWQMASDAISYREGNSNSSFNGTSVSVSLDASADNLVVFTCTTQASRTITGPGTDYTQVYNQTGIPSMGTWYKISSGGTENPSCSWSPQTTNSAIILEYSGVETTSGYILDTNNSAIGTGDNTIECPSVTPSTGTHLYISTLMFGGGNTATISSWSNSFTERVEEQQNAGPLAGRTVQASADKTSTGTQSTTATASISGTWRCHTLAFNEDFDIFDGRAFTDDDEGTSLNSQSVCGIVNNGTSDCTTTDGSGYFKLDTFLNGDPGDQLTFYLDGGVNLGNTVSVSDGDDITTDDNLRLYEDHVVLRDESGQGIRIVDMDAYDDDQNATDMLFDATDDTTDTLSVEGTYELFIQSGYTFAPGGNVTQVHDIEIDGVWTAAAGETVNIDGTYKLDTGGTLNPSTSTVTFDGTAGTEDIITDGTGGFYNLTVNDGGTGSGLTLEVEDALTVHNNLTITGGTLDVKTENNQINVGGNFDDDDIFLPRNGTVVMDGSDATTYTIDSDGSDTNDNFYNITFNDAAGGSTYQLSNILDVDNNLTITGGALDSNGNNITVGGNWTNDDTFTEGTATVTFDGGTTATIDSGCADEATCTNENFYNLTIDKDEDATVTLSNTHLRVTNLINVVEGWLIQAAQNIRAEGTTAIDIDDFGRWQGLSTGNVTLGGNVVNDGNITLNANGISCGDADSISINSTDTNQRSWGGEGGFRLGDVDVQYQTGTAVIHVASGTNSGNNGANWSFIGCDIIELNGINFEGINID